MAGSSANGLQFLFEKSKGVDNIHIYNQSKDPIKISKVEVETNVFVGDGHDGERNLTNETRNRFHLPPDVEPGNEQKIAFFSEQVQEHGLDTALNMFFTPWGSLYYGPQERTVRRAENAERYMFTLSYAKPVTIGPYERLTLSYSNSFHGLPIRSPIRGVQYLPRVSVTLDQGPQYRDTRQQVDALARPGASQDRAQALELAAMILNAETGQRVLDTRMANKAKSADLTRRLVGYYANYFMYKRNYFVTDIPVDLVNCISYGMMGLELDGSLSSSDEWADNWQVAALQYMKQLNPSLRVSLIVGGWPKSPMLHFRTVAGPSDFPATAPDADDFWIYHARDTQQ
ncbi:MAG: glycosyl hydrolase family 18 protein, partial [Microvirgula sp.]